MAGLKDIRKRITSVKSTRQITKAMKMVSAAKFRKAQGRMMEMRPYADKMASVLASLSGSVDTGHPLMQMRPVRTVEVVVLTSDRGLCGAFNTNVMKAAVRLISDYQKAGVAVTITAIGKKATDLFRRRGMEVRKSWQGLSGRIVYLNAQEIAREIIEGYTSEAFDEVVLVYNEFRSALVQKVSQTRLLPLTSVAHGQGEAETERAEFLCEPSQQAIFDQIVPKNLDIQVFRALLESQASEEAARMTAMENATKAANDMIGALTLQYNKARQAAITKELMDIVGGVEALKGS
ncbi:MAG: ATP synthase F1 subunit gamma [Thermodesulfovibrionales bacterium]|jgi:F-type H+-transporting ATPase subunit gamma